MSEGEGGIEEAWYYYDGRIRQTKTKKETTSLEKGDLIVYLELEKILGGNF